MEKSGSILGLLPQWMKDYTQENLKKIGIEIVLNTVVSKAEDTKVFLSDGKVFDNAILIWASGVRTADFFGGYKCRKEFSG